MAQFGRPVADIAVGSWTTSPLWDKLDEVSADDATTEITTGNNPSNVTGEVRLGSVTDPNLGTGHVLRIRAYTTNNCTLAWALYQETTLIANCGTITLGGSYATSTYNLTEAEAAAITNYSDLRVRFTGNGQGRARVSWIELEVPNVLEQKSGSGTISGPTHVLGTILKTAVIAAAIGILGHVAATGIKSHHIVISGGGAQTAVGKKSAGIVGTQADDFNAYGAGSVLPNPPYEPRGTAPRVYGGGIGVSSGYGGGNAIDTRIPVNRFSRVQVTATGTASEDRVSFISRIDTAINSLLYVQVGKAGSGMGLYFAKTINGNTVEQIEDLTVTWAAGDTVLWESWGDSHAIYINGLKIWSYSTTDLPTGKTGFGVYGRYGSSRIADDYSALYVISSVDGQVSGGGTVTVAKRKDTTAVAAISGGGNVFVASDAASGAATISGDGTVTVVGVAGVGGAAVIHGGGVLSGGRQKGARVAASGGASYFDDFNRPNTDYGGALGTDWTEMRGPMYIHNNRVSARGGAPEAYYLWNTSIGPYGQYCRYKVGPDWMHSIGLRGSIAEPRGWYKIEFWPGYNTATISRMQWISTLYTVGTQVALGVNVANNDVVEARIDSDPNVPTISIYLNGVLKGSRTDNNAQRLLVGDYVGISHGGWMPDYSAGPDDWYGGSAPKGISGGGAVSIAAKKNGKKTASISGGGSIYASIREEARRSVSISGGGSITLTGRAGTCRGSAIHGGGSVVLTGRAGRHVHPSVTGNGTLTGVGDSSFIDTASVFALIHGGGSITSNGSRQTKGEGSLYGGGRVSVSYDRSWEVIPFQKIDSPDSVCYLIKMEMDYCSRTFGVSPCLAAGTRCYNTWKTCKYIAAYVPVKKIYRYVSANFPQAFPDARPYIADVKYMPTEIKTNLTVNARVSFTMLDEPDADVDTDPYWSTRSSHPGTYWKRWLARNANYKDRIVRIFEGVYGRPESTYVQKWTGRLENIKIKGDKFTFEAVDLLKDLAKIEVPPKTNAKLALALAANAGQTFTITEDADKFPASGYVRIEDEIIRYTALDVATKTFTIGGISNRSQFGTVAAAHAQNGKVQQAKFYAAKNPLEILLDMLLGDAGMADSWVDTANVNNVNAAFTTTSAYVELGVAGSQSWPSVGIMKLENWSTPGVIEYVRYTSKTYVPGGVGVSPAWRFNFETYSGVMTGRALFGTPRITGGVNSIRAEIGYFEYVDTDAFYQYRDWPARDIDFTSIVSEPTKLSDLYMEIVDLLDAKSWVAENLKITLRKNTTNTPTTGYVSLSDADNIIEDSGSVDVNEKSRISRMTVYWDKVATGKASEEMSYRRLDIAIDPDAETNYGDPVEKVVKSRWIDPYVTLEETVQQFVKNLAIRRIQRCKHAQNLITVKVPEKDAGVKTGDYVRLSTDELLESDGNPISARMYQVVKRERGDKAVTLTFIQVTPRRMAVIAPAGLPAYPSATEVQRAYGYICDATGKMSDGTDGYFIW